VAVQREFINPKGALSSVPRGYSHVAKIKDPGTFVYVAGQGPVNEKLELVGPGDIEAQARATFQNIKRNLEAAGATFNDVVKMNVFVTDIKNHQWPVRNVRAEFINKENPPVSAMVEVPRLAVDGMMIEVEVVALLP
jgi:enamine deaminase RidA (YjgF/YER057c/UK114 family)